MHDMKLRDLLNLRLREAQVTSTYGGELAGLIWLGRLFANSKVPIVLQADN